MLQKEIKRGRIVIGSLLIIMASSLLYGCDDVKEQKSLDTESFLTIQDIEERYERTSKVNIEPKVQKVEEKEKKNEASEVVEKPEPQPKVVQAKQTNYSRNELQVLAQIIHAESEGEPYEGKLAVGNVIMNRIKDGWFPDCVETVVFQTGQFSPVSDGSYYNTPSETSRNAAKDILAGERVLPSDVLYFYNPDIAVDPWIRTTRSHRRIGNHMFSKSPN